MGLGHWEILAIVLAVLLIFGGRKIPELMKGVGSGMREFKQGLRGESDGNTPVAKEENGENQASST
ncbi:twin-arginine translocase TatA/TatE family subunit [candidate division LCP-89 bacterium B3_LCP]|uniref:Sec-independent protein translocase protein TatA n=1 Tax=candidate division LCP-89 bacterium B3_LCP TaxID=2012998 RepID=A0A532UZU0_UNCL8|nr:MAG: twin-arginine translocase TatA/TatE family subunit [candidate division LCP-89 bacterium B3_LCP]